MSSVLDTYKVAVGHNVAQVSLVAISPQPRSDPAAPVERKFGLTGAVYDEGLFMELEWDFSEVESDYLALLTQFGLHNALYCAVTIYGRTQRFAFARYNGIAQLPEGMKDVRRSNFFIRDITIRITHLTAL